MTADGWCKPAVGNQHSQSVLDTRGISSTSFSRPRTGAVRCLRLSVQPPEARVQLRNGRGKDGRGCVHALWCKQRCGRLQKQIHTTVRPVLTVLRTARITIAAARASRPEVGSLQRETHEAGQQCQGFQALRSTALHLLAVMVHAASPVLRVLL